MNKKEMLYKIQQYNFAAYDMLLYLDTQPDNRKAFKMFRQLVEKYKKIKSEYEENFGPLEAYSAADFDSFRWLESPWPWERRANA